MQIMWAPYLEVIRNKKASIIAVGNVLSRKSSLQEPKTSPVVTLRLSILLVKK